MKVSKHYKLDTLFGAQNAATVLDEKDREEIGKCVVEDYTTDEDSRKGWVQRTKDSIKLALQVKERKTEPWVGASNVKYPLLTEAALQFQSRAYPALVTKPDLVKCRVMGDDPTGQNTDQAQRKSDFMSYQLLEEDENWEEDTDRLFLQLPIVGCMFRKTYFDTITARNCSDLILPDDFVVSYYTKTLAQSPHYTIILHPTENEIEENMISGEWLEVELPEASENQDTIKTQSLRDRGFETTDDDSNNDRKVLEQYRRIDLDGDGYSEPYICTVDHNSRKLLRLDPNFTPDQIRRKNQGDIDALKNQMMQLMAMPPQGETALAQQQDQLTRRGYLQAMASQLKKLQQEGKIIHIDPIERVTKYPFIPSPDGGFYDIGFGQLLLPINDAVDTIINQLIDAGTLANSNPGFIASNARVRGGNLQFKPFELKRVEVPAGVLKDGILPLEVNPPSPVLFQLLELLINQGQTLSSATEVMTGQLPGQNTKAGVAQQALDQGMKVFSGIVQRLYRAFTQEYRKLYKLNSLYLDPKNYFDVLGIQGSPELYKEDFLSGAKSVLPEADPNLGSDSQRLQLALMLADRATKVAGYSAMAVEKRILKILRVPNINEIYPGTPPPPNPEIALKAAEQQRKTVEAHHKYILNMLETQARMKQMEVDMWVKLAELKLKGDAAEISRVEQEIARFQAAHDALSDLREHALAEAELQIRQQEVDQQGQQPQGQAA